MSSLPSRAAVAAFLLWIATTAPAYAYLDPGTGSIILQSLIGAAAAGLIVGRGYWYRIVAWVKLVRTPASRNGQPPSE